MAKKPYDSLGIPPAARNEGGFEVLRAAVVGQGLTMSMRRSFDDPALWGALLATVARQAAQMNQYAGFARLAQQKKIDEGRQRHALSAGSYVP